MNRTDYDLKQRQILEEPGISRPGDKPGTTRQASIEGRRRTSRIMLAFTRGRLQGRGRREPHPFSSSTAHRPTR